MKLMISSFGLSKSDGSRQEITEVLEVVIVDTMEYKLPFLAHYRVTVLCLAVLLAGVVKVDAVYASGEKTIFSLEAAVQAAQRNDPWLVENRHSQDAVEAMSVAAGTLPDPRVSLGLALPTIHGHLRL